MFSEAPIYDDLETVKLGDSLSMFMEQAGADNPGCAKRCKAARRKRRADELVRGTRLKDVAYRKQLAKGGRRRSKAPTMP